MKNFCHTEPVEVQIKKHRDNTGDEHFGITGGFGKPPDWNL
jgi:hypothetical protein